MKNKRKNILLIAGMLLALLVGILAYSAYTQKQIYQESTANLLSTYGQSAKTFTMFAQRNWNILNDWDSYLGTLAELGEQEGQWQEYIAQKATWQYTDFPGNIRIFICSTSSASSGPPPGGRAQQST